MKIAHFCRVANEMMSTPEFCESFVRESTRDFVEGYRKRYAVLMPSIGFYQTDKDFIERLHTVIYEATIYKTCRIFNKHRKRQNNFYRFVKLRYKPKKTSP